MFWEDNVGACKKTLSHLSYPFKFLILQSGREIHPPRPRLLQNNKNDPQLDSSELRTTFN